MQSQKINLVGIGQDSHKLITQKDRPLVLGGEKINFPLTLKGNSDADVIYHSICNALSSAIGGDSISTWADNLCKNKGITDSSVYVKHILKKIHSKKYLVGNISIAVEAKAPRIDLKTIHQIKKNIAKLLLISYQKVGITFTSGEGLTTFGKGQAIQSFCIVNLISNEN